MKLLDKILVRIRKNKKPHEPDIQIDLSGAVKWLLKRKRKPKEPPRM